MSRPYPTLGILPSKILRRTLLFCLIAAVCAFACPTFAAAPLLEPGSPAPPLDIKAWYKGTPIAKLDPKKTYVVEFWATWCGPCIQAMPHLSVLQAEYKDQDVTILSTNIREMQRTKEGGWQESFDDQTLAKVESFVRKQGSRMAYTVAYDGAAKGMDKAWIGDSSRGIPVAFVVDRAGVIAWIGHPIVLRMPLHEIAGNTWDAKTSVDRVKQAEEAYIGAMRLFPSDEKAGLEAWDRAARDYPLLANDLLGPKFDALLAAGRCEAAYATGRAWLGSLVKAEDVSSLNRLAWSIVDPSAPRPTRDLDLALKAAEAANGAAKGEDAGVLDTLARVHFCKGDIDKAIELQTLAVGLADEDMRERLAPALEEYRKAKR